MQTGEISPSERMWAALAHAILLLNVIPDIAGIVIIITIGIWLFNRRRSPYVDFQALQAFIFQAFIVFLVLLLAFLLNTFVVAVILMIPSVMISMYGAYRCNQGQEFRYPILGNALHALKSGRR